MRTVNKISARCVKTITLSAFIALRLGAGIAAFAQGLPPGAAPTIYGSPAFHDQPYQTKIIFARIIGQFRHRQADAQRSDTSARPN